MSGYLCPKDFKPCSDDLCRGGGCLVTGEALFYKCPGCGELISDEHTWNCKCDPDADGYQAWGESINRDK